jgi:outer membrane autotransporter protein
VKNNDGSTARVRGPTVGAYAVYVYGGISVDSAFKVDFLHLDRMSPGIDDLSLGMTNFSATLNLNNKYELNSWWIEPTAGIAATRSIWDAASRGLGFDDGTQVRLQSGIRFGTSVTSSGIQIDPSLAAMIYDDVIVDGGGVASAAGIPGPTDQGKLFGQLIGKLNFTFNDNLSTYVEAEVRGREDVLGAGARVGVRYSFR